MERFHWFRQFLFSFCLSACALFAVSCGERPVPGPISPNDLAGTPSLTEQRERRVVKGQVRPVPILNRNAAPANGNSLAKGAYTDDQLIALINQQPALSAGSLKTILLGEAPLSSTVLMAVIHRDPQMSSGDLKTVLLASSPLPVQAEEAVQNTKTSLSSGDLQTVMEAQAGFGSHFLGTTVSKPMTKKTGGLLWHGGHRIQIPKDALPQDQKIFIAINPSNYVQADFGPDTWFNKPVTVAISYKNADLSGIDVNALTISWYDETIDQWIDVGGTVNTKTQTVSAKVWHFTQYTLSAR
jgi:hypothetical protein